MVDIHSHCLPALDDGAKDVATAVLMLEDAHAKGISTVVATPHCRIYSEEELLTAIEKREASYELLMQSILEKGSKIPYILKGFEVYLDKDITEFPSFRELCIEGTSLMLIEMPVLYWDNFALRRIEAVKEKGIVPIIAHIERYMGFKKNIEKALSLEGVIYQVNADAFLGIRRRRLIRRMAGLGKKIVAGSDMHNLTTRKNRLDEALRKAMKINESYGAMFASSLTELSDVIYLTEKGK